MSRYDWSDTIAHRVLPDGSTMRVEPLFDGRARLGISNPIGEHFGSYDNQW